LHGIISDADGIAVTILSTVCYAGAVWSFFSPAAETVVSVIAAAAADVQPINC